MNSIIKNTIVLLIVALVAGCGGSDAFTGTSTGTGGGGSTGQPSVTLSLTDGSGIATTSISVTSPGTLKATVVDSVGNPVAGAVVAFTTTLATFNPTAGSALTNSSGVATVILLAGAATGADTVTADVTVSGATANASKGYTVAAPSVSLSSLTIGIGLSPLSALGTTSLTVTVLDGAGAPYTTPVDVAFSSICSASGKATISSPITTANGVATSNYLDQGCANTDTITASLTIGGTTISKTASLVVQPASAGSVQFVSANPTNITLKGTGGAGKQETSIVTFKVVDAGNNPLSGATVNFTLSTTVGGIALIPSSASSDANGEVTTVVSSGSVATAVRVIAAVSGTALQTQSDQLTITTGVPAQDHFSLAASTHAIEGWNYDGVTSNLSVILSDHFSNPVPDGTAITFIAEGAQVGGTCTFGTNCQVGGKCTTLNGQCSVMFNSAELRPSNGRVGVLAYGVGEEGFTDVDGDGYVSSNAERVDANGDSTDTGEAWLEYDEDGTGVGGANVRGASEPFIDFDKNGSFDSADGSYNGVLCKEPTPSLNPLLCSITTKNINVRRQDVIVLSGSSAFIKASDDPAVLADPNVFNSFGGTIDLDHCTDGNPFTNSPVTVYLQITDLHGNTMPAGTIVSAITTNNGTVSISPTSPVPDNIGCVHGDSDFTACPAGAPDLGVNYVVLTSDATQDDTLTCTNSKTTGFLTITVTSPKGLKTSKIYTVTD